MYTERISRLWGVGGFLLACGVLLSACLKDGVLPPKVPGEGRVALEIEITNGSFALADTVRVEDGTGAKAQFNTLKFYLSGVELWNADSVPLSGLSNTTLLLDAGRPRSTVELGVIPNGHIEEFRFVPGIDQSFSGGTAYPLGHPFSDPDMQDLSGSGRLNMLMAGFVDQNDNGVFDDGVDHSFEHRLASNVPHPPKHFHIHADMVDGQDLTLAILIDLRILLLAVDLSAPLDTAQEEALQALLLNNLSAAIRAR